MQIELLAMFRHMLLFSSIIGLMFAGTFFGLSRYFSNEYVVAAMVIMAVLAALESAVTFFLSMVGFYKSKSNSFKKE